nr:MAG TPA: Integrase [Caudoviricetes sp.]
MPKKRKTYPKLPNGFGSIRYLGKNRRNCYAVHPPATLDAAGKAVRPPAICYVDDWLKGFAVLTAYKAGTYKPGMENDLPVSPTADTDTLVSRILADYGMIKGVEDKHPEIKKLTFTEVYERFIAWKFAEGTNYSKATKSNYSAAYSYCTTLYDKPFEDLKATNLQEFIDNQKGLKKGSLKAILVLFNQMYKYAIYAEIVSENKSKFVKINKEDDTEHGTAFSEQELKILWKNSANIDVQLILIMCYSGWRIGELENLEVNLDKRFFQGGSKTKAGKDRIVPIHPCIYDFVKSRIDTDGTLLNMNKVTYRMFRFYPILEKLGMVGSPKHTPHDCRHTFSALCEKYSVRENDRKRMLGHSFGNDVTNAVYGHRTLEELRSEIKKIKVPFVTNGK